jgi:putative CocE/NonD family hydrolase
MRLVRPALAALAFALAGCTPESSPAAEAPTVRREFQLPAGAVTMPDLQAAMRDGVRLRTSVWLPQADGKFPVVLVRTPYETEMRPFWEKLLGAGYAVVEQHERGAYLSEGEMRMLGRADEDGWDTLDWITRQGWSNGAIATYGCSSSAENQLKLASLGHPAHKAMVVGSSGVGIAQAGPHNEGGNFWRGGVWQMGWADYFFGAMPIEWPQLPAGLTDEQRTQQTATFQWPEREGVETEVFNTARMHLPMIDLAKAAGAPDTEIEEYLQRGPAHPAWAEDRVTNADVIKIPGLWAEAAYDISAASGAAFFEKTRAENPAGTQAIVITNGPHCGFGRPLTQIGDRPLGEATVDWDAKVLAWLDRWLKGNAAAQPQPAVEAYMAGANLWATFSDVPTPDDTTGHVLFLTSGGKANTAAGDGALSLTAPTASSADTFAYDPANPVISHGGQISGMGTDQEDGSFDQREIEKRPDVLVYSTPPLDADLAVFGFVTVQLAVASDAPDTDFTVKLVDVAPDGTAWNISDTIQRMRYRKGDDKPEFMKAGETYTVTLPPMLVANVFQQGHSVRVEVSSSNFPTYARNLNTANDPYASTEVRIANNKVLHGPGAVSKIVLPVTKLP